MESMVLIAALVVLFAVATFINWQRHHLEFKGRLYWSLSASREFSEHGVQKYTAAKVLTLSSDWHEDFVYVEFPDGEVKEIGAGWLCQAHELPGRLY